ncbi:MAG: putative lipid II flippase FtsW [Chloroflexi bacterium]|nr:MAG: putative lipid II flippase FtsW [Chloroflexota bacterium]
MGDKSRQGSNAGKQLHGGRDKTQMPPVVRSPALEAAERQKVADGQREIQSRRRHGSGHARYAAEQPLSSPQPRRKSLPRLGSRSGAVNILAKIELSAPFTSVTAPWRDWREQQAIEPVRVISEEEEKKLRELEMRLPRVAGKIDPWLVIIVLALVCIGLVMVYSASSFSAARTHGDASYFFQRQLVSALFGTVTLLVTMRVDYRVWRRFSLIGMVMALPLLVLVLLVGTNIYGASRWLILGPLSFQPSEFVKLVLALYVADWLARKGNQVGTFLYGLVTFIILVGLILGLVLLEKDMGTAIIIAGLATVMFFTAGANILQFLLAMGCGALVFLTQTFHGYRYFRVLGFLDPFNPSYLTNINLQLYQSLLALGSGGWFGLGLGASRQKTGYLPFPYIDSIFAILGEELGFIGCTLIVLLFLGLAFRGFRLARRTQDVYGALLATGITTWLVLQAIINIGASTGSIPYTGVPLSFISYGGTSLVVSMAAVGVLLNISRYTQEPEVPALSRRAITNTIRKKK